MRTGTVTMEQIQEKNSLLASDHLPAPQCQALRPSGKRCPKSMQGVTYSTLIGQMVYVCRHHAKHVPTAGYVGSDGEPIMAVCRTCKAHTKNVGTKRCDNCWEVEKRLGAYLRSAGGRQFVRKMMTK